MKKEFVPYEIALRMKQLGFDGLECFKDFDIKNKRSLYDSDICTYTNREDRVSAPTFQQAFRWFRENYGLFYQIETIDTKYEGGKLTGFWLLLHDVYENKLYDGLSDYPYTTYEETELACLEKLIEIVEEKLTNPK